MAGWAPTLSRPSLEDEDEDDLRHPQRPPARPYGGFASAPALRRQHVDYEDEEHLPYPQASTSDLFWKSSYEQENNSPPQLSEHHSSAFRNDGRQNTGARIQVPSAAYGPEIRQNPQPIVGSDRFNTTAVDVNVPAGIIGGGGGEPPDEDPEARFEDPEGYFSELERLEALIVNGSSLKLHCETRIIEDFELYIEMPTPSTLSSVLSLPDDQILQLCRNASPRDEVYAKKIVHLLRCRNIMFGAYENCCKLIATDFGGHKLTFLVLMQNRKGVAELVSYTASSIKTLAEEFDHAILRYLRQTLTSRYAYTDQRLAENALKGINDACSQCLRDIGLWDWDIENQPAEFSWYCVAQTLDLAIISFVGVHTQDIGNPNTATTTLQGSFDVPGQFFQSPVHCTFRRRHLDCLDPLLGGEPVWVFHPNRSTNSTDNALYLSANMRDFSHIWGPVWVISPSETLDRVKRWDVGGGCICPWPLSGSDPPLFEDEIFCHWLPVKDYFDVPFSKREFKTMKLRDTLLIGAGPTLQSNQNCKTRAVDFESRLLDADSLHDLKTTDSTYYVDAVTSAISLGGWGINISGSKTFKRRNGQTLKSALLDRWSHDRDGSRMILDLDKGYGLEMSFCSLNARRTKLIELFRTGNLALHLEHFDWDDEGCRAKFMKTLKQGNTRQLLALYKENVKWRKDIRDAILYCLRMLAECCVDSENSSLSIPWISGDSNLAATFTKKKISWTGFLCDTRDTSTFGMLVQKCLAFDAERGRACGHESGKPVLHTQLRINIKMQDNWMKLKKRSSGSYYWSISALFKKHRFPLGSQGSLTVVEVIGGGLVMEWSSEASTKAFFKKALGWNGGMHHQEYILARWNTKDCPITVFIESKHRLEGNRVRRSRNLGKTPHTTERIQPSSTVPSNDPHERVPLPFMPEPVTEISAKPQSPFTASKPVPAPQSSTNLPEAAECSDLGSDGDGFAETNGWKWDKKIKLWRRHVYTDGELDYTTWTRDPQLAET